MWRVPLSVKIMATAEVPMPSGQVPILSVGIPLSYLPRLADTAGYFSMSFGPAVLLLLLGLDLWRSFKKKSHWIPGESFVLGALSLQLLENEFRPIVSIADTRDLDLQLAEELFVIIRNNQLLILGGRVVTCVFYGILLPGVARRYNSAVWSDILALAIGAVTVLIHISYEIYIIVIQIWIKNQRFEWNFATGWLFVSNTIIFASIVLLVLLMCCAVLASKSITDVVDQRIPVLLFPPENNNPGSVESWEATGELAVWSWITTRTYKPEYIIARSVLSAFVVVLVTVCIVVSIVAVFTNGYQTLNDGLDWSRLSALTLQGIFILRGWAIILWRWLTAVAYYPRRLGNEVFSLREYFRVEGFWIEATLELQEFFKEWHKESIENFSVLQRVLLISVHTLGLYKFLPVLRFLQILLIKMSKICWLISEIVFSNRYMARLLIGPTFLDEFMKLSRKVRELGNPDHYEFEGARNHHNNRGVREQGNPDGFGVGGIENLDNSPRARSPGSLHHGRAGGTGNPDKNCGLGEHGNLHDFGVEGIRNPNDNRGDAPPGDPHDCEARGTRNPDSCGVGEYGNPNNSGGRGAGNLDNSHGVGRPGNPQDCPVEGTGSFDDFIKYSQALMHMKGENIVGVWLANQKSIEKMKAQLRKGESSGRDCRKLISLLGKRTAEDPLAISSVRKLQVERDFNVGESSGKMTAVSLLTIMIELSAFYKEYGVNTVENCIQACLEAWEIMKFVDDYNFDWKVAMINKHADRLFFNLKESPRRWLDWSLPSRNFEDITVEAAKGALQCLADKGKQKADIGRISCTGYDSINWKGVILGNSMYNMCETIKNHSNSMQEMLDVIESSLANVIWSCMLKAQRTIMDNCMNWASVLQEDQLLDALYVVGMAKGIIQPPQPEHHIGLRVSIEERYVG